LHLSVHIQETKNGDTLLIPNCCTKTYSERRPALLPLPRGQGDALWGTRAPYGLAGTRGV
jgi:hypothetical protein